MVRSLIGMLLFVLLVSILLALPVVQTRLGKYATDWLKDEYNITLTIEKVAINPFGGVKLKGVFAKDNHNDTLFHFRQHVFVINKGTIL